jgi:hypothetical protein
MSRKARIQLMPEPREKIYQIKCELCHVLKRFAGRQGWTEKQFALHAGCARTTSSYIENLRVDELTVGQLFTYLARIEPRFRMLISL